MDWLDIVIVIVLIAAIVRGIDKGFARQLLPAGGFFGGLFLGAILQSKFLPSTQTAASRAALSISILLGCAFVCLAIGEFIAVKLKSRLEFSGANKADKVLGGFFGAIAMMGAVWLGSSALSTGTFPGLQQEIQRSAIISQLNRALPEAPRVIAKLGNLITPNGFPQVFSGIEPEPNQSAITTPDMGELTDAVRNDQASVVKVEGEGCGGIVEGSGFVASDGLVVTNAHVVAGVERPKVIDANGRHSTTVIWFNPDLDLAILRANNLAGSPLSLVDQTVTNGTQAAVLGYPGGGAFQADPAATIDAFTATGRNIYGQESATREIYSLKAEVISGNSGGPLVNKDGAVVGVVFARSVTYDQVGYALTMPQVVQELNGAKQNTASVGTGNCAE
jgi:S1-C subfamily serine protease